ncbi:MAG: hypothetical protein ACXWL5_02250 [Candidatus Chromulinivorax sp.]
MKKQILYFAFFLQLTNITLSFDPLSIGLFAGAVSLFAARQKALDQNKNETAHQYNPNTVEYKHPQPIIAKQLKGKPFFNEYGQLTEDANALIDTNFTKNPEFLENLKKSKAGVEYYNDNTTPLLKSNPHLKDQWWVTQIKSAINNSIKNVTIDQEKEMFAKQIENANKPKALSLNQNTNETSINNNLKHKYYESYLQTYKKHKNAANPWSETTQEFSEIVTYTPVETKFIKVAKLDASVPLTRIPAYRQFPWLARLLTTPESFSDETTAYSKSPYLYKREK